ncbi:hypothetical protein [Brachybacterium sp. GPGPB12]
MAHVLSALGVEVTLIARSQRVRAPPTPTSPRASQRSSASGCAW